MAMQNNIVTKTNNMANKKIQQWKWDHEKKQYGDQNKQYGDKNKHYGD